MPTTEQIGDYEIEYAGEHLADVDGWAAFVTVYGPSTNPMHRNALVSHQRVAVEVDTGYGISVLTQPAGQTCTVTNGTGIMPNFTRDAAIANPTTVTCVNN